ncbi:MAG: response regulator [Pirellulaceae bacterium]
MPKRVLDVGNCVPDHAAIRSLFEGSYQAEVLQAHGAEDCLELLDRQKVDLVLVNRKLDRDYTDGLDIIKEIKAHPQHSHIPCMLISNYPNHQEVAVAAGAEYGFGKKELYADETQQRLARILS